LDVVEYLSREIGERVAGSRQEKGAAEYIAAEMRNLGLSVGMQSFRFVGWKPVRLPSVQVVKPEKRKLESAVMLFSESTAPGGVAGRLSKAGTCHLVEGPFEWAKYSVTDQKGTAVAYVLGRPDGPAVPFPLVGMGRTWGRAPYVAIGQEDNERIAKWLDHGENVSVRLDVAGRLMPGLESRNVIGTIKGNTSSEEEVVLSAHYDSAYFCPGADDDASGIQATLSCAKALEKKILTRTVKVVAFGAEEYSMLGSQYYVETLKEQRLLSKVKGAVHIDMAGVGRSMYAESLPDFNKYLEKIVANSTLKDDLNIIYSDPHPSSDHWPFLKERVPAVMFSLWPYVHWHRPTDTHEKVERDTIEKISRIADLVVTNIAKPC